MRWRPGLHRKRRARIVTPTDSAYAQSADAVKAVRNTDDPVPTTDRIDHR
jgi:hypothetical protein